MIITKSQRLIIRSGQRTDAEFILTLLNQSSFYEYIGNKGINTHLQAADYIQTEFIDAQQKQGFGPYVVMLADGTAIGIVGLFQRDYLQVPDIGYAFLAQFTGNGYATEACTSLIKLMSNRFPSLAAITTNENKASQQVLNKLAFIKRGDVLTSQNKQPVCVYFNN
ncbi:GNAT family N-acetyltransferase [Pseudoalteromonas sp. SaAl2]